MKKFIIISVILYYILSVIIITLIYNNMSIDNYFNASNNKTEASVTSQSNIEDNNIIIYNNDKDESSDILDNAEITQESNIILSIDDYFHMLPNKVQTAFYKDNWQYKKVDYSLGERYYNNKMSVFAITNFEEHIIYIDNRDISNKALLHEIGHRFEHESYVKGCNSKEFNNLYIKHWAEWYVNYGGHINNYNTIEEAYAQLYEIYFLNKECLDIDTINFIENELNLIEKSVDI